MGIYNGVDVYGIRFYNFIDDIGNTLYEKASDKIFTKEMIEEAKQCYEEFYKMGMHNIFIKIYVSCCDTYSNDNKSYMSWKSVTKDFFLKNLNITKI